MKAVRYYGKEDVRLDDTPEPEVGPGQVKVAPAWNGICGSDLHLYFDGPIPPAPFTTEPHPLSGETLPVVFGHEFSGVVEKVGEGVTRVAVGDHVAVEPLLVCDECPACRAGKYNLCEKMGFIGISGGGGGLSEHMVIREAFAHPVGNIPLDQAALVEPLSVSVHAIRHAGIRSRDDGEGKVAVVGGAGPIGLTAAAVLKAYGVRVIISELADVRRQKALDTGVAEIAVNPAKEDLVEVVRKATNGFMADIAIDAAGVSAVVDQLFSVLGPGGRIEVVALHGASYPLDILAQLTLGDHIIGSCVGYAHDHEESIRLIQSGEVDVAPFVTGKITADRIVEDGFERLRGNPSEVKILVSMK